MNKLIINLGARGSGKSTITNGMRDLTKHSVIYKLSGSSIKNNPMPTFTYYMNFLNFLESTNDCGYTVFIDDFFFTERNFCQLGYKEYSFEIQYNILLSRLERLADFYDISINLLFLGDADTYAQRLNKRTGKVQDQFRTHSGENSLKEEEGLINLLRELPLSLKEKVHINYVSTKYAIPDVIESALQICQLKEG